MPNEFALVYLFSAQTFFTGAASLLGMLGQGSLTLVVVLSLLFLLLLVVVVAVELQ